MRGIAHPSYKTGRYSQVMAGDLRGRYHEALTNPRLLSLTDDIALQEARKAELLAALGQTVGVETWAQLKAAREALVAAQATGDTEAMQAHWDMISALIERGHRTEEIWEEIRKTDEVRKQLVQAEMKTMLGLQQMITVQQHMVMVGALTDAAVRAVHKHADADVGRKILRDLQAECTRLATLEAR